MKHRLIFAAISLAVALALSTCSKEEEPKNTATAPIAPSSLAAVAASSSQINLTWSDNSNNETGFRIERSPDNSNWGEIATAGSSVTSYQNTGLTGSTTYYYRVRAYNAAGSSAYTSTVNATTQAPPLTIPAAPSSPSASAVSSTQINLSWTDNSNNETGFSIERSPNNSTWAEITTVGSNITSYQNTGLAASTMYYYRVRAYNGAGNSSYTSTANATTQAPPATIPAAPSNPSASAVSSTQINFSWTDNSNNETGFRIERSPNNSTWAEITTVGANITSYQNTGLTASTLYYYRVRAYNGAGNSAYTSSVNATTQAPPVTIPTAPSNPAASAVSSTQINFSWADNSNNETGFRIERSPNNSTWTEITTVGSNITSYQNTGLTASTLYYYRVRAYNGAGNSGYTSSVNATNQAAAVPPSSPSNLAANATNPSTISLTWNDNSNNETGFEIQREHTSLSTWVTVTTVAANATSYTHSGLSETWPGYRVRAVNATGSSSFSNEALAPAKLRIVNNLYSTTPTSGNDWYKLNKIVRARFGPSSTAVTASGNTYEKLCPYDNLADIGSAVYINPSYNATTQYRDFPVSTYGYGANYYFYIECGWWEYFIPTIGSGYWIKRLANVLCTNGTCCCFKWAWVQMTNHTSGYYVITAKDAGLPWGNWNNTVKGIGEGITIDAKNPAPKF